MTGLTERLLALVRPEFRGEVFYPPRDSPVFFHGVCRVGSCPTAISATAKGLCQGHYQRWKAAGRPEIEGWAAEEDVRLRRRRTVPACHVDGCNRAAKGHALCHRHLEAWYRDGRADQATWLADTVYRPSARSRRGERGCAIPGCERWTDGPNAALCRTHYEHWRTRGRPDLDDWSAELSHGKDPRVRLADLNPRLRLEIGFGLQRRYDEARKRTPIRSVVTAVNWVRNSQVDSLLAWSQAQWRDHVAAHRGSMEIAARAFLLDTRFRLEALLIAADPWADQFPRDVWDLRHLGITHPEVRYLRFGRIAQPWLAALAKRWCRWRLARGLSPSTVAIGLAGVAALAVHLQQAAPDAQPYDLSRARIEAWLAAVRAAHADARRTASQHIHAVSGFLKDVHRNGWQPDLPAGALIFRDDTPAPPPATPRWIPEQLMRQLEHPEALAQFPSADGRVLLQILMACGLRLKDARHLLFDCLIRDHDGAPYLAWLNRKMGDRPAFFPLSETLAELIAEQQQRVRERHPAGCPWLFPARKANLDGARPVSHECFRDELNAWLGRLQLRDEHGQPVKVTSHQFRHTLATRLINKGVPQHVVQQLLDHTSPEMTAVYARLHNDTVRRHWEQAVKVDGDGQPVTLPTEHPLADAAWSRHTLVRAKVTLPNGYCGAPVQTDCDYANPCLDCRFFITTGEFLDVHRRQREQTQQAITHAEDRRLLRIVEKNTRTLHKLDTIIAALGDTDPAQVVTGGKATDLDAAG